MQVMCVKDDWIRITGNRPAIGPVVGDIDTVIDVNQWKEFKLFMLERFPDDWYSQNSFATLPTADAEEMREEVREGIINIEKEIV